MKRKYLLVIVILLLGMLLLEINDLNVDAKHKYRKRKKMEIPYVQGYLTLNAGENLPEGSVVYDGHLYVAAHEAPAEIVKIKIADFKRISALSVPAEAIDLAIYGNYLYALCDTAPARILRINLNTFSVDSILDLGATENLYPHVDAGCRLVIDDSSGTPYLYIAVTAIAAGFRAGVARVNLNTFLEDAILWLNVNEDDAMSMVKAGQYLYVSGFPNAGGAGYIAKVDIPTLTRIGAINLATIEAGRDLAVRGNYLYAGGRLFAAGAYPCVARVDLATFTQDSTVSTNDIAFCHLHRILIKDNKLYGLYELTARVAIFDLDAWPAYEVLQSMFPAPDIGFQNGCIYGNYLYAFEYHRPGIIVKILISITDPLPTIQTTTTTIQTTTLAMAPTRMRVMRRVTRIVPWVV